MSVSIAGVEYWTFYDAAFPPVETDRPISDGFLFYVGGDTPHVWTTAEITEQPAQLGMGVWVRSNPEGYDGRVEAGEMVTALRALGVPTSTMHLLDIETAIDPGYVNAFGGEMVSAGYALSVYGSVSTIKDNPPWGGYFVSNPTGVAHMVDEAGVIATQYLFTTAYDLSIVSKNVPLWNKNKSVTPPVKTILSHIGDEEMLVVFEGQSDLHIVGGRAVAVVSQADLNAIMTALSLPIVRCATLEQYNGYKALL